MIDFMANIKNKKNMTKCNMKTLMATSALCVFFNGALIYGTDNHTQENVNNNNNEQQEGPQGGQVFVMKNVNNDQEHKNNKNFNIPQYNGTPIHKLLKEEYTNSSKKLKKGKNNSNNIFFNYKDHFSLLFCCNLCNDKAQNRRKYLLYKRRRKNEEFYDNESSQGEDEISIISFKKVNVSQGEEKPNEEESKEEGPKEEEPNEEKPNEDVNDDMNMPKVIK